MTSSERPSAPRPLEAASEGDKEKTVIGIVAAPAFVQAVREVVFAANPYDRRPYLNGVLIEYQGPRLILVACDGCRLSMSVIDRDAGVSEDEGEIMVEAKDLKRIRQTLFPKNRVNRDDLVRLGLKQDNVEFILSNQDGGVSFGNRRMIPRFKCQYPPWRKIIPEQNQGGVIIKRKDLLRALKSFNKFIAVRIESLGDSHLSLWQINNDGVETTVRLPVTGRLSSTVAFPYRFLSDLFRNIRCNEVQMSLAGKEPMGVIRKVGEENFFLHLMMPVIIKST